MEISTPFFLGATKVTVESRFAAALRKRLWCDRRGAVAVYPDLRQATLR